jgi:hypothetical protein
VTTFPQTFNLTATAAGSQVVAPLTGTVTTGTWLTNQHQALAGSPSGLNYMQYNVLLPAQYSSSVVYPILGVFHPDGDGMNGGLGGNYPKDGSALVTGTAYLNGTQSDDSMFNNVAFRTAFPCIVIACQSDQTGGNDQVTNFGGFGDSMPNSSWNEQAVNLIMATIALAYSTDALRYYCVGYSLGAIGSLAFLVDNNRYNGVGKQIWAAGAGFSDQLVRNNASNASVFTRMSSVPYFAVSTSSDNSPTDYDEPFWTSITGNTNYPSLATYTSGGMAAVRAGTSNFYYVNNGSGTPDQCLQINAIGGIGTAFFTWLFSFKT